MKKLALLILALSPGAVPASDESPYAGEERRNVKSLSESEVKSLQTGKGMGFAKLAELNHYPGPRHVLDLADELELTPSQYARTEKLFEEMRHSAIALGERLLRAEAALDRKFEQAAIHSESLETALLEIGDIRARLRFVHLQAHLHQRALLTTEQVSQYDTARGYGDDADGHDSHSHDH